MRVVRIPLLSDNYAWLLVDEASSECAVVDPSEAAPVLRAIDEAELRLRWILATHHHWDHTGGIEGLVAAVTDVDVEVYGSAYDQRQGRVPAQTHAVADGDSIDIAGSRATCLLVPGHTLGAVAFHFAADSAVFTGDTLFTAGCGRLFEGTPAQMHASVSRLRDLPDDTWVYCGHEYTEKNMLFSSSVVGDEAAIVERLEQTKALRADGKPTVPALLSIERQTNLFLRADDPVVQRAVGFDHPVEAFAEIRRRRDKF